MCGFVRLPPAPVWTRHNYGVQPQAGIFDVATEGPRQERTYIRIPRRPLPYQRIPRQPLPWRRILMIATTLIALALLLWGGTDPNPEGW